MIDCQSGRPSLTHSFVLRGAAGTGPGEIFKPLSMSGSTALISGDAEAVAVCKPGNRDSKHDIRQTTGAPS